MRSYYICLVMTIYKNRNQGWVNQGWSTVSMSTNLYFFCLAHHEVSLFLIFKRMVGGCDKQTWVTVGIQMGMTVLLNVIYHIWHYLYYPLYPKDLSNCKPCFIHGIHPLTLILMVNTVEFLSQYYSLQNVSAWSDLQMLLFPS